MLKIKLKCRNVPEVKIAKCLCKYGHSFPFYYKIKAAAGAVEAEFNVNSQGSLNELTRRLKHIKGIEFEYAEIERLAK
jgi:hypothetical protein